VLCTLFPRLLDIEDGKDVSSVLRLANSTFRSLFVKICLPLICLRDLEIMTCSLEGSPIPDIFANYCTFYIGEVGAWLEIFQWNECTRWPGLRLDLALEWMFSWRIFK